MKISLRLVIFAAAATLAPALSAQTAVTVSLSASDTGRVFEGVGGVSAGASSRLLVDYPEPYRGDILDFLFKPKFGAGFQHLKVEVGGGENSTCGSEPTHVLTRGELAHPRARGYEFWLMKEARRRNPQILLDCLPWSYPHWVSSAFSQDSTDWLIAFLDLARQQGTPLDWLSAGWNEKGTNRDWIVNSLRPSLDAHGYRDLKLQAPDDSQRFWTDFDKYGDDAAYQNAVKAVGYHYLNGREPWTLDAPGHPATAKARDSGKPLWDSEEWSQSGKDWDGKGSMYVARVLNKMYIRDRVVKTELWCPIDSIYRGLPWDDTGPLQAVSPWSGHYTVWPAVWALAQTTQFAQPGWQYLDHACGRILSSTWKGTYVTLKDPATSDWSTIVCTDTPARFVFKIGAGLKQGPVHVWSSDANAQFVHRPDLAPSADGTVSADLGPDAIYSFTTTTGQTKGEPPHPIPPEAPFPFPFHDDFKSYAAGDTPKYFSDQKGTFEVADDPDRGKVLAQIVPQQGIMWWLTTVTKPYTVFGDNHWADYAVSADVKIAGGDVEVGGRFNRGDQSKLSYRWILDHAGNWKLNYRDIILAQGTIAPFDAAQWHSLRLVLDKSDFQGWIDGKKLADVQDSRHARKQVRGMADLASTYDPNRFARVAVTRVGE